MSNPRSASNAWAKIKIKLLADNPEGAATPAKPKTPRKKAGGKKDLSDGDGAGIADGEDNVPETPKKTPRKRAPKKQDVDGEESPKKKGRTAPKTPNKKKSEPTGMCPGFRECR